MSYQPVDLSHVKGYNYAVKSGIRSNYCVPEIEVKTYDTAYENILRMCEEKIDYSMFDITLGDIKWTEELWMLYCDLKYNLRIDFTPLVKKYKFKNTTFYERVKKLLQNTDIYVPLPIGRKELLILLFFI